MREHKTPCGKYTYLSYGLQESIENNKAMLDFCKNHCKTEVCEHLKNVTK